MYLFYLDESGDAHTWEVQKHFVLGGVAIHEGQVFHLGKQLDEIQAHYFPGHHNPIAFHATDIRNGKGIFRELRPNIREQLLQEVYRCIENARFPNLIAFATAIHESSASSPDQVIHDTFQDICQRFNTLLNRQYNLGYIDKGLLIIDRSHEDRYKQLIADFKREGTEYGYLGNVVDIPFFARRHDTRMIQLADFCAYAVFRYYEKSDTSYFNHVLPRFDKRSPRHPPDGLKHIIRSDCTCAACSWRKLEREVY
jgi:hypothetical protein